MSQADFSVRPAFLFQLHGAGGASPFRPRTNRPHSACTELESFWGIHAWVGLPWWLRQ